MDALNEKSFSRKDKLTLQIAIYWKYIFFSVESFFFVSVFAPTAYDIANKFSIFAYYTLKQTHTLVLSSSSFVVVVSFMRQYPLYMGYMMMGNENLY